MTEIDDTILNRWKKSRAGAWAGRGFHYQHLFTTLILVRQWAGLAPAGWLVPEGLEDCVLELEDRDVWLQIKSRETGTFSEAEVKAVFNEITQKASLVKNNKATEFVVGLERPCSGAEEYGLGSLFSSKPQKVVVCSSPEEEIISLLIEQLQVAEIIAEGLASDLYKLVAKTSAANASVSFKERKRISTTEIDRRIFERLEAEDPSAIDLAFLSRILEPIDFKPINEPGFYQGVKSKPGHVASGLILSRPKETENIIISFKSRRHLLITGPSGAGKSALMWLVVNSLASEFRWFQITNKAGAQDADAILRFIRARRPTKASPIALAFDEVGTSNSDLWNILVNELRGFPEVFFLGSVRIEDGSLISNQSDTAFFEATLNETLAQNIWEELTRQGKTSWSHWREPFEQSEGLMLEYIHLLTQGERLAALIGEQVSQREKEGRHDELAIIRCTAVLAACGAEIDAKTLITLLEVSPARASQALKRLINEHLVRESRPGVLGGLHTLRSKALCKASHDEVVYTSAESLWGGIRATTMETLPHVIQSVLAEIPAETEKDALQKLAEILADSTEAKLWAAILTGLGLGSLERYVTSFTSILEKHEVQRAQWSLASMFADATIDIPDVPEFEQWQVIRNAISDFRTLAKRDLRTVCLEMLPVGDHVPICTDLRQANQLMSCLVPIAGGDPVQMTFVPDIKGGEHDIRDVAALLSTAYLIGPAVAQDLATAFGDEPTLLTWFRSQTPWLAAPIVEPDGSHGRTIRANWFFVAEGYQPDPHETICNICETLLALSPVSDAAASDAIDPSGQPIQIGEYRPWSKNIPRENLPAKSRVAWNVAFRQILLARAAEDSLTNYAQQMAALVRHTEKVYRYFSERWIKGGRVANLDEFAAEINEITKQVNALAYVTKETPAPSMAKPATSVGKDDGLGALLTCVLGNLVPRMGKMPGQGAKALATFAGSLSNQAQKHIYSPIWRTTSSPPLSELSALATRLKDIASILHEMAYDVEPAAIFAILRAAKKGGLGRAVGSAARHCSFLAEQRFRKQLRKVETTLEKRGLSATCWTRPVEDCDSIYWPAKEVAILIDIVDFERDAHFLGESLTVAQEFLKQEWRFRIVPVINSQVVSELALLPSSLSPMPDLKFKDEWRTHIDLPLLLPKITQAFDKAMNACNVISAILNCRDLNNLHPEEDDVLSKVIEDFHTSRELVLAAAEKTNTDEFGWAIDILEDTWNTVVDEFEAVNRGLPVAKPLCMNQFLALDGEENQEILQLGIARMLLLQAESRLAT